jgi:DNA-binding transcriptional regulator YdaS (Cro superfamily)
MQAQQPSLLDPDPDVLVQVALALDEACKLLGGRENLAAALKVSYTAVGNWKARGVPHEHCVAIERLTKGAVTRQMLRPLDWQDMWPELIARPSNDQAAQAAGAA